jgi:hypothetical protein
LTEFTGCFKELVAEVLQVADVSETGPGRAGRYQATGRGPAAFAEAVTKVSTRGDTAEELRRDGYTRRVTRQLAAAENEATKVAVARKLVELVSPAT